MKHAYLILAHNEWALLQILLNCIDDPRNDIYVHIDAKVKDIPQLTTEKAGLKVLQNRVDVRWGDLSVVEAEYALFETAVANGPYEYYHLLSGVDLPLKSQDYIHDFCSRNSGKEFIGYTLTEINPELERKVMRYHLYPRLFKGANMFQKALRALYIRLQMLFGIRRNKGIDFKKGSQWVSVTQGMAEYFIDHKEWVMKTFHHTFCSDEIVMQTLCWQSPYKENIYLADDDGLGCMRAIGWHGHQLENWKASDYDTLAGHKAFFARKFDSTDMDFIHRIEQLSKQ